MLALALCQLLLTKQSFKHSNNILLNQPIIDFIIARQRSESNRSYSCLFTDRQLSDVVLISPAHALLDVLALDSSSVAL